MRGAFPAALVAALVAAAAGAAGAREGATGPVRHELAVTLEGVSRTSPCIPND